MPLDKHLIYGMFKSPHFKVGKSLVLHQVFLNQMQLLYQKLSVIIQAQALMPEFLIIFKKIELSQSSSTQPYMGASVFYAALEKLKKLMKQLPNFHSHNLNLNERILIVNNLIALILLILKREYYYFKRELLLNYRKLRLKKDILVQFV